MKKDFMSQQFKRDGTNIFTTVTISFVDAINGCKMPLKTLTKSIMLTIPSGTQPETQMRLKNQGLTVDKKSGDLYVTVKVNIPQNISEKQKELLSQWDK